MFARAAREGLGAFLTATAQQNKTAAKRAAPTVAVLTEIHSSREPAEGATAGCLAADTYLLCSAKAAATIARKVCLEA